MLNDIRTWLKDKLLFATRPEEVAMVARLACLVASAQAFVECADTGVHPTPEQLKKVADTFRKYLNEKST